MVHGSAAQRLHEDLNRIISTAEPGEQLPSEPGLAQQLGVSRATLREAMRIFETQGLISRRQGVGTFVLRPANVIESGLEVLESIETQAKAIGLPVTFGELEMVCRPADETEAKALELDEGAEIMHISRVILAENRPVAYLIDTLPADVITCEEIEVNFSGSVLDLLLTRGDPVLVNSRCEISAVAASSEIARLLNLQRGDALLRFVSSLYDVGGKVMDYSLSYFIPGYFRFHVVRQVGGFGTIG